MSKKVALYARVSTDEQAKGFSLSTQLEACREYALGQGYTVEAEFAEDYTGTVLDRPELNKLRELLDEVNINAVIVYDVDRLARKAVYQILLEEELNNRNITIEYVLGQYEDNEEGRLQKQIRASIAEYEKAKIIERLRRGKKGKAKSGYVIVSARPPFGYEKKSEPHKAWLVIDEEESKIVKLIFHWFLNGDGENGPYSMNAIARKITSLGIPTRGDKVKHVAKKRGKAVWQPATIRKILGNETYAGFWNFGKTKMVNDKKNYNRPHKDKRGAGKQVANERENWIEVEVPAIIDPFDFARVQEQIRINNELSPKYAKYKYLMGQRLKCAKCGYSYVGRTRKSSLRLNQYYYCKGRDQTPVSLCDMSTFRADDVNQAVWIWLSELLQIPGNIADGLHKMQEEIKRSNFAIFERLALIDGQLNKTEEKHARLLDLYLEGDFPLEVLNQRKDELKKSIIDLKREQTELNAYTETVILTEEGIAEIESFCESARSGLDHATFEVKRKLIELLDVRGKLAIENEEKVIYISCKLLTEPQRRSLVQTSLLRCNHNGAQIEISTRLAVPTP